MNNTKAELNTVIDYSEIDSLYHVFNTDTDQYLFSNTSLQGAWDEIKVECERREVVMGDCDYRKRGPDTWEEIPHG